MPATSALLQEGRYRLDHPISETSESSVFQGYDTVRDTRVVVKEIVALANRDDQKLSFTNQAKALASVRHDSLIHVEDYFSEIGRQYLVLEAVEGDDLESLIEKSGTPFSLDEAASWAEQVLDALHYLHTFDPPMLHRRVQPKNIRRLIDGRVKLLAYSSPNGEMPITTGIVNEEGEAAVLNYSPLELIWDGLDAASQKVILADYDDRSEKILKSPPDARSDVYSVGATLYRLLTARVPVDPLERSIEMLEGNPDPLKKPRELNPCLPEEVCDVIMRAMEIKRENRFDSAVIMRQVLRAAFNKVHEDRELAEAAEALKAAEKAREEQTRKLADQKAREEEELKARRLEEEKRRTDELEAQERREAEEKRLAAERAAAEAEQELKDQEARKNAAKPSVTAVEERLELAEDQERDSQPKAGVVSSVEAAVPAVRPLETEEASESPFSYEETKSGSKLPIVIGALVVLVLAAVGGWVFLGSGSPSKQSALAPATASSAPPSAASEQPAATEPVPVSAQSAAPEEQPESASQAPAAADSPQSRTAAKPAPPKAAKPAAEPAKTPEKKKVTVDDLINDN